ncbi:MAG: Gfo/Idh/MocA family oxidoreductase [Verrucomicrobiota bacterium JB022]|nr:Gfo/Idh/MocA family oxidoreductase [Verrucomicrobiota bacterium JB022]
MPQLSPYAPSGPQPKPVVSPGECCFAASHFEHGHIYMQIDGLAQAGGTLTKIYEPDDAKAAKVLQHYPDCKRVACFEEILEDPRVRIVTSAAIPDERCDLGLQVLRARKEYLTDKAPFTTLDQLQRAWEAARDTGQRYMCCYSERLLSEAAYHAGELIRQGAIGQVLQVINLAPHNLGAAGRPDWFFQKARYGGILTDIGSHQFEQFLHYTGATDGVVNFARVENFANPAYPELEDFGEASLTLNNGASCYCRLDWFNPAGLRSWGDGRTFALGTKGTLEIRKQLDVGQDHGGEKIYLVDQEREHLIDCQGKVGFPFFGQYILDVLHGTEQAMTQAHSFKAAELSLRAQAAADAGRSSD